LLWVAIWWWWWRQLYDNNYDDDHDIVVDDDDDDDDNDDDEWWYNDGGDYDDIDAAAADDDDDWTWMVNTKRNIIIFTGNDIFQTSPHGEKIHSLTPFFLPSPSSINHEVPISMEVKIFTSSDWK